MVSHGRDSPVHDPCPCWELSWPTFILATRAVRCRPPPSLDTSRTDSSKESAPTLSGVGYLPLPVPFLQLYGKLGVARLHSDAQVSSIPPTCPVGFGCTVPYTVRQNQWTTDLAYGAGAQARFGSVGIRAEYERINASPGSPDLFSLGVTWTL